MRNFILILLMVCSMLFYGATSLVFSQGTTTDLAVYDEEAYQQAFDTLRANGAVSDLSNETPVVSPSTVVQNVPNDATLRPNDAMVNPNNATNNPNNAMVYPNNAANNPNDATLRPNNFNNMR